MYETLFLNESPMILQYMVNQILNFTWMNICQEHIVTCLLIVLKWVFG